MSGLSLSGSGLTITQAGGGGGDITIGTSPIVNGTTGRILYDNAGVVGELPAPTGAIVGTTDTQTLSAKRIDPRVSSTASASSVTPSIATADVYVFTALAAGLTINAATGGTPLNGDKLLFRLKDDGTPRLLTWTVTGSGSFRAIGVTLPTTTTASKVTYVGCVYNSDESFWDVVAVTTQA